MPVFAFTDYWCLSLNLSWNRSWAINFRFPVTSKYVYISDSLSHYTSKKKNKKKSHEVNIRCLSVELRLKMQYFYTKDKSQRQIECAVQNGTITKNGVLPVIFLFFKTILSGIRITYKELIWCANYANVHMFIILFVSAGVLFEGTFSLWVSLTSKYLSIFSNKSLACWVVHITRYFLSCYSCSRYSSMVGPM